MNPSHVLRLVVCHIQYQMSLLKLSVYATRVIPLDTIITLEIVCPPEHANYSPFLYFSIKQTRGSTGSYGTIIFTTFPSRLILSIAPQELKRCWGIWSTITCPKPENWSTSVESKTGCTSVTMCFFSALYTAVYLLKSAWFCHNCLVPSACSWAVHIAGG